MFDLFKIFICLIELYLIIAERFEIDNEKKKNFMFLLNFNNDNDNVLSIMPQKILNDVIKQPAKKNHLQIPLNLILSTHQQNSNNNITEKKRF